MKIAVCDHDSAFLEHIASLLEDYAREHPGLAVSIFSDSDRLIRACASSPFDAVFMDVITPTVDGIEVARKIRETDEGVKIVFLASSPQYAVESYTVRASDYLLKPIDQMELFRCLDRLKKEMRTNGRTMAIRAAHKSLSLNRAAIECFKAHGPKVEVIFEDGAVIESVEPIGALEERLLADDRFFKCHRSYIVNIDHIKSFAAKGITMRSGRIIPVSRSCKAAFKNHCFSVVFNNDTERP